MKSNNSQIKSSNSITSKTWKIINDLFDDFQEDKEDYSTSAFKEEIEDCFSNYVQETLNVTFTEKEHEEITETALQWFH